MPSCSIHCYCICTMCETVRYQAISTITKQKTGSKRTETHLLSLKFSYVCTVLPVLLTIYVSRFMKTAQRKFHPSLSSYSLILVLVLFSSPLFCLFFRWVGVGAGVGRRGLLGVMFWPSGVVKSRFQKHSHMLFVLHLGKDIRRF